MYNSINETGELHVHKGNTYHFYFNQSEFANENGKDKKDVGRAMQWLKKEGYVSNYIALPKPGYIWKATYVTLNEKFINEKIGTGNEDKTSQSPPPDTTEETTKSNIIRKKEMEAKKWGLTIEIIDHLVNIFKKYKKGADWEQIVEVAIQMRNKKADEYKLTHEEMNECLSILYTQDDALEIDEIVKKWKEDNGIDELDGVSGDEAVEEILPIKLEHKQEKRVEEKEQLPITETIDEQISNEISIIDIAPPAPFSIEAKRITPKKKVKQEKQTSGENKINIRPQKKIKFGKERLENYLSNNELVPPTYFNSMEYSSKKRPEYKCLVNYIWQWCMTSEKPNNKEYATRIYQTLSEICRDNKEEYNRYIDKINAKVKLHNYNLELQNDKK
jgi:hypothetical protein